MDKAWHAIHWLLVGSTESTTAPAGFLLGPGDFLAGDEPEVRLFVPSTTREIAQALTPIDGERLMSRFDIREMARLELYPQIWSDPDDVHRDYVVQYYEPLRRLVTNAANSGEGLAVYFM